MAVRVISDKEPNRMTPWVGSAGREKSLNIGHDVCIGERENLSTIKPQ
jgi:hypothetical protein